MTLRALAHCAAIITLCFLTGRGAWALEPLRLPGEGWDGPQFVQADRAGNVYFLKAHAFEVYPLSKKGDLGEPVELEAASVSPGVVRGAAMSPTGDRWLLLGDSSVRFFIDGKEKVVPSLGWKPWSLTLWRDVPVVAVAPFPMGGRSVDPKKVGTPPWLLRLGSDRWDTVRELKGVSVLEMLENGKLDDEIAKNAVVMTGDRLGRLWVGRQYAYRVQRLSPSGKPSMEITVDRGEVRKKEESRGIEIEMKDQRVGSDAAQKPASPKGTYFPFTAERVIYGMTEGRDGRLYLLVNSGQGGAVLDRYDPVRTALERIPVKLPLKNTFTLAAGRNGLYFAPWDGMAGRWYLSWERIEAAQWKPVKGAEMDGLELEPDKSAQN